MNRALVLVQDADASRQLAHRAATIANATDAELIVARVLDEDDYQSELDDSDSGGDTVDNVSEAEERAEQIAADFAADAFGEFDISYSSLGAVAQLPEAVTDIAEAEGCDHVFIVGRRRSPTGKAIFGDLAQSVILNFDGMVTVLATEDDV